MPNPPPLHRERRNAARLALYGSLLLTGGVGLLLSPLFRQALAGSGLDQSWASVDWTTLEEVQLLQGLLRIDTTAETGSEVRAAEFLARELEAAGMEPHIDRLPGDRANLWAILEGRQREALVLHNHLDTDPIHRPGEWTDSPWSGIVSPPWIYGRGAFDMKSVAIAQLRAMTSLAASTRQRGALPERSVIFLATSSEETDSELGTRRILEAFPDLASRFWAVLTEGGVLEAVDNHRVKYWGTEFAQKRFVEIQIRSERRDPLDELVRRLEERGQPSTELVVIPEVESFLSYYGPSRDAQHHVRLLADPHSLIEDVDAYRSLPIFIQALFRNEIYPFPVEEDPSAAGFRLRVMLHLLPGANLDEASASLLPRSWTEGMEVRTVAPPSAEHGSPIDHPVLAAVEETISGHFDGEVLLGPYFLSFYATDSRFFRRAGIPSYGFTPFVVLTTDTFTITGPNERLALPAFVDGVELYAELVQRIVLEGKK